MKEPWLGLILGTSWRIWLRARKRVFWQECYQGLERKKRVWYGTYFHQSINADEVFPSATSHRPVSLTYLRTQNDTYDEAERSSAATGKIWGMFGGGKERDTWAKTSSYSCFYLSSSLVCDSMWKERIHCPLWGWKNNNKGTERA